MFSSKSLEKKSTLADEKKDNGLSSFTTPFKSIDEAIKGAEVLALAYISLKDEEKDSTIGFPIVHKLFYYLVTSLEEENTISLKRIITETLRITDKIKETNPKFANYPLLKYIYHELYKLCTTMELMFDQPNSQIAKRYYNTAELYKDKDQYPYIICSLTSLKRFIDDFELYTKLQNDRSAVYDGAQLSSLKKQIILQNRSHIPSFIYCILLNNYNFAKNLSDVDFFESAMRKLISKMNASREAFIRLSKRAHIECKDSILETISFHTDALVEDNLLHSSHFVKKIQLFPEKDLGKLRAELAQYSKDFKKAIHDLNPNNNYIVNLIIADMHSELFKRTQNLDDKKNALQLMQVIEKTFNLPDSALVNFFEFALEYYHIPPDKLKNFAKMQLSFKPIYDKYDSIMRHVNLPIKIFACIEACLTIIQRKILMVCEHAFDHAQNNMDYTYAHMLAAFINKKPISVIKKLAAINPCDHLKQQIEDSGIMLVRTAYKLKRHAIVEVELEILKERHCPNSKLEQLYQEVGIGITPKEKKQLAKQQVIEKEQRIEKEQKLLEQRKIHEKRLAEEAKLEKEKRNLEEAQARKKEQDELDAKKAELNALKETHLKSATVLLNKANTLFKSNANTRFAEAILIYKNASAAFKASKLDSANIRKAKTLISYRLSQCYDKTNELNKALQKINNAIDSLDTSISSEDYNEETLIQFRSELLAKKSNLIRITPFVELSTTKESQMPREFKSRNTVDIAAIIEEQKTLRLARETEEKLKAKTEFKALKKVTQKQIRKDRLKKEKILAQLLVESEAERKAKKDKLSTKIMDLINETEKCKFLDKKSHGILVETKESSSLFSALETIENSAQEQKLKKAKKSRSSQAAPAATIKQGKHNQTAYLLHLLFEVVNLKTLNDMFDLSTSVELHSGNRLEGTGGFAFFLFMLLLGPDKLRASQLPVIDFDFFINQPLDEKKNDALNTFLGKKEIPSPSFKLIKQAKYYDNYCLSASSANSRKIDITIRKSMYKPKTSIPSTHQVFYFSSTRPTSPDSVYLEFAKNRFIVLKNDPFMYHCKRNEFVLNELSNSVNNEETGYDDRLIHAVKKAKLAGMKLDTLTHAALSYTRQLYIISRKIAMDGGKNYARDIIQLFQHQRVDYEDVEIILKSYIRCLYFHRNDPHQFYKSAKVVELDTSRTNEGLALREMNVGKDILAQCRSLNFIEPADIISAILFKFMVARLKELNKVETTVLLQAFNFGAQYLLKLAKDHDMKTIDHAQEVNNMISAHLQSDIPKGTLSSISLLATTQSVAQSVRETAEHKPETDRLVELK